jgi:hypothetical protein
LTNTRTPSFEDLTILPGCRNIGEGDGGIRVAVTVAGGEDAATAVAERLEAAETPTTIALDASATRAAAAGLRSLRPLRGGHMRVRETIVRVLPAVRAVCAV